MTRSIRRSIDDENTLALSAARIIAYCRAGFEAEAAADLRSVASVALTDIEVDAAVGRGFVVATPRSFDSQRWPRAVLTTPPVFVRALFFGTGPHQLFDAERKKGRPDRVAPLTTLIDGVRADLALPGASHAIRPTHPSTPVVQGVTLTAPHATAPVHHAVARAVVRVARGDSLWAIAGRSLKDPLRWREIWRLNHGRVMADGRRFTDPDLILPGWRLRLPG